MNQAVKTENLKRVFKTKKEAETVALAGVDIEIRQGELFGVLGPNGAGKTTLIKILSTLLLPSSGRALVDGVDVATHPEEVRKRINMVSGGEHSGYGILNVRENLWMFSQFYGVPTKIALERIDFMLKKFGLWEFAKTKVGKLSTGMRQKMNIIRGFVPDPKILFLDEPTLGLDVQIAREVRAFIKEWMKEKEGRTILLTTHYMAEADELCDRVAIIDRGQVLECGTPAALKRKLQQDAIYQLDVDLLTDHLEKFSEIPEVVNFAFEHKPVESKTVLKIILKDEAGISKVTKLVESSGSKIRSLSKREPSLEDVFVAMVGRGLGGNGG